MSYFGGPIMHANTTVLVDWGSSVGSTYTSGDPGFLQSLAAQIGSPANVSGILAQYLDTSGLNYSAAGYDSQVPITPSTSSTSITDAQIQSELKAQVGAGILPAPAGNGLSNLYVVLFPSGTQVCDSPSSCSGTTFCAYHGSTALNGSTRILYAVMPDMTSVAGCQQNGNSAFQSHTVILSHEWAEAINDPLVAEAGSFGPPLAWYDSSPGKGEIGDICNQQSATNGSYKVQREWSNLDGSCVSTESAHYFPPTAAFTVPGGASAGQAASFSGSGSTDPSGNHASVTYSSQTHTIPAGIASWSWSWGDGSASSSGVAPSHTFTSAGTYTVTLTVRDNLGFTGAVTHQVTVGSGSGGSPSPPPQSAPAVSVQPASDIGSFAATLHGTVDPRGGATSYHFDYGTTSSYGSSTPSATAGSGSGPVAVSYALPSLAASTTYHYRVVASNSGGTAASPDMTFTTASAPIAPGVEPGAPPAGQQPPLPAAVAPKLTFSGSSKPLSLTRALKRGVRLKFRCDKACTVSFNLTFQLPRGFGRVAAAVILARGSATLKSGGSGVVVLRFNRSGRKALAHKRTAKLVLTGYAKDSAGHSSAPSQVKLVLRR